ncbi:MAG: Omp28-related outer membrane protein [Ignavibacteriaceae bacterium]
MRRLFFILPLLLLLSSCKTTPPNDVNGEVEYVKIYIVANVDSALIYVNDQFTGKYTPDTLEIQTGRNVIRLEKDGYLILNHALNVQSGGVNSFSFQLVPAGLTKAVLMESFSNVSCSPCVMTNGIIKNLKLKYGASKLVIVKVPAYFPSPFDVFYVANKPDANARLVLYNIQTAPTVILDGVLWSVPSDSNSIISRIETRLTETPKFSLSVKDSIGGGILYVSVRVQNYDTTGIAFGDLVLHTVVVEEEITFTTPPGSNGETVFHNVMRKMLPGNTGSTIPWMTPGKKEYFSFEVALSSAWQHGEIKTISFIQNKKTKEIFQSSLSN